MRPGSPDRIVFESGSVCVGEFRCPVDHPSFRNSGPSSHYCFVFPRTSVVIRHSLGRVVSDPTIATLYNADQEYEREPVSPEGDRCEWFGVAPALLREAVALHDSRAADDPSYPIRFSHANVDADTYLAQRRVYIRAAADRADPLWIEESVVTLLDRVLANAYGDRAVERLNRRTGDVVHDTQCVLGADLGKPLTLADIAVRVGASAFHLCRCFRLQTGRTMHGYRTELRLRRSLDALEQGERDLTRVALEHGFSSHSHYTSAFRRAFGEPPSRVRGALQQSHG